MNETQQLRHIPDLLEKYQALLSFAGKQAVRIEFLETQLLSALAPSQNDENVKRLLRVMNAIETSVNWRESVKEVVGV